MALQTYPKEQAFRFDATARTALDFLRQNQTELNLTEAIVFCDFPLFKEEGNLLSVSMVIVSPSHGVILIATHQGDVDPNQVLRSLEGTFSHVFSRLIKYPRLRSTRTSLRFTIEALLFLPEDLEGLAPSAEIVVGIRALGERIQELTSDVQLDADVLAELISVLDGSKALIRPPERDTSSFAATSKVVQISRLEEEIRRFDRDQRIAYMTEIGGTQRIRGLAGSGKTVVLAMKAALTAIRNPEARIAFTFYTRSLYQHVRQLITRFYRLCDDRDPDWTRLKVLHAWGGGIAEGMYSYSAKVFGETPLTFSQARTFDPRLPFDYACKQLLAAASIKPLFDYVFLDEAQDFPPSFLRLALKLAEGEKLVIAYDVLQTIFDVEIPTAEILFGTDETGEPAVSFEEDVILHRCYRNPREVLVAAHAVGFGIYAPRVVQMLESKEHWEDFGYEVTAGNLVSGSRVVINRPAQNSPCSISDHNSPDELIQCKTFTKFADEINWLVREVTGEIKEQGVSPEDILVISVDDRNARNYFRFITHGLAEQGIATNNHQDDSFGLRDFQAKDQVTLATVYKAKGNEAFIVYVVGIDALFQRANARARNVIFTAMTRAKGWLRITGIGAEAEAFAKELEIAKSHLPRLEFTYPRPEELIVMKRDLTVGDLAGLEEAIDRLVEEIPDADLEEVLVRKLKAMRARKRTRKKRI